MRYRVLGALAAVTTFAALGVTGPAGASGPTGPCATGEDNSGQITAIQDNGGGSVTVSAWLRYCAPATTWELAGMPAFGEHRVLPGGAVDARIVGTSLGTETGYREVVRTFTLGLYVTDVCLHPSDWSVHCWTVRTDPDGSGVRAAVGGPNTRRLNVFGHLSGDPDPGCGNCWGDPDKPPVGGGID